MEDVATGEEIAVNGLCVPTPIGDPCCGTAVALSSLEAKKSGEFEYPGRGLRARLGGSIGPGLLALGMDDELVEKLLEKGTWMEAFLALWLPCC